MSCDKYWRIIAGSPADHYSYLKNINILYTPLHRQVYLIVADGLNVTKLEFYRLSLLAEALY